MSRALAKVAPLKPDIRLGQAVSEFEADLSAKQKVEFQALRLQSSKAAPDPSDVMRLTARMDKCLSNKFGGQCFGPRFTNFVQGVQQFAALGDILVGGSQNLVACGVWSVVRISLLSFVNLSAYIDKLSSLFMAIGRTTPRYQGMALLYPQSKALQSSLAEYFIVVVSLCHYLYKFGQKSSVRQFTSSLSDAHLKNFQTDLDKWANSIKEEMHLAEAQENSKARILTRDLFKSYSYQQGYASKIRMLDFCSKYDHETTWKQTRKLGNTSIYTQAVVYQKWKACSNSCTLVYTGKLGSGKSVLLANIVDDLNLSDEKDNSTVAYFFCKHDIRESLEARTIVGSLTRQLLCTVPDFGALTKRHENTYVKGDTDDLICLLGEAFPKDRKAYIVLDGIDECEYEQKEKVAEVLRRIQEKFQILVCISSRDEPGNGMQVITDELLATRIVSLPEKNPDIEAFIETELERCLQRELLTIGDPTLIFEIQDALLKGSQGMFLWVALQIRTLCDKKTDYAIREALADLPKSLSGTFARILQRPEIDLMLQENTLRLVLAASRPLTTEELREALSVVPGDATWDPSKLLHDAYSALACCGCLLTVDEEELTVRVIHHSVKQYLLAGDDSTNLTRFTLKDAQRTMANIVVTYLCYGVFGTELSRVKAHPVMAQSLPSKIVQATLDSSSNRRSLAIKFLKSRKQPTFDMSKAIAEMNISSPSEKENSFTFYRYASIHWVESILRISGDDAAIVRLAPKLIRLRASTFKAAQKELWTLCQEAVENGNEKNLGLLLQARNIDINSKKSLTEETTLIRAASQGYIGLAEMLLNLDDIDVKAKDWHGRTALFHAASNGDQGMVKVILESGKADVNAKDHDERTALMIAALNGRKGVYELLLKTKNVDINVKGPRGRTVLMEIAANGREDMVAMILSNGKVHVNKRDASGQTALMYAVSNGHRRVVNVLLETGRADVCAVDNRGVSALQMATDNRSLSIVDLLNLHGASDS